MTLQVAPETYTRAQSSILLATNLFNYAQKTGITVFEKDMYFNDDGSAINEETDTQDDNEGSLENLQPLHLIDGDTNKIVTLYVTPVVFQRANKSWYATQLLHYLKEKGVNYLQEGVDFGEQTFTETSSTASSSTATATTSVNASGSTTTAAPPAKASGLTATATTSANTTIHENHSNAEMKWSSSDTLLLLESHRKNKDLFKKGKKSDAWLKVTEEMNSIRTENGLPPIPVKKTITKMETLRRKYSSTIDSNGQSGEKRHTWEFLEVMDELFSEEHWVKPPTTAGLGITTGMGPAESKKRRLGKKTLTDVIEKEIEDRHMRQEAREQNLPERHRDKMRILENLTNVLSQLVQNVPKCNHSSPNK